MQETSTLYKEILSSKNCTMQNSVVIGEGGALIDATGDYITFGGFHILVDSGGPDSGYGHELIKKIETDAKVFSDGELKIGTCYSGEIDVFMNLPNGTIPRMARIVPYVRLTDGTRYSEWIQKGIYWVDTRDNAYGSDSIAIHGYDTMLMADVDCPVDGLSWPARDIDVLRRIAAHMGTTLDSRTVDIVKNGYRIQMPMGYSAREVLGYIAAAYGGCFVMSDAGQLRMIQLGGLAPDTSLLCTSDAARYNITVGGVRIIV